MDYYNSDVYYFAFLCGHVPSEALMSNFKTDSSESFPPATEPQKRSISLTVATIVTTLFLLLGLSIGLTRHEVVVAQTQSAEAVTPSTNEISLLP